MQTESLVNNPHAQRRYGYPTTRTNRRRPARTTSPAANAGRDAFPLPVGADYLHRALAHQPPRLAVAGGEAGFHQ